MDWHCYECKQNFQISHAGRHGFDASPDLDRQYKGNSDPDPNEHQKFADPLHCYKVPFVWYLHKSAEVGTVTVIV